MEPAATSVATAATPSSGSPRLAASSASPSGIIWAPGSVSAADLPSRSYQTSSAAADSPPDAPTARGSAPATDQALSSPRRVIFWVVCSPTGPVGGPTPRRLILCRARLIRFRCSCYVAVDCLAPGCAVPAAALGAAAAWLTTGPILNARAVRAACRYADRRRRTDCPWCRRGGLRQPRSLA